MAGHYPLKRESEPVLFNMVEAIKGKVALLTKPMGDFSKFTTMYKGDPLYVMKLSKDYVENPESEIAFTLGDVNLESITDEDESLTHGIDVEVHLSLKNEKVEIKDIFWVA